MIARLEITFIIPAAESTLRDIHTTISDPSISDTLAEKLQQALVEAGVSKDIQVKLPAEGIILCREGEGGLSAEAWLETERIEQYQPSEPDVLPEEYQD